MKSLLKSTAICLTATVLATVAMATEMKSLQGKVTFTQGDFLLITENQRIVLTGLSRDELNLYSGQNVMITGEAHNDEGVTEMMEVYKIQLEKQGELVTLYDWDVVNNELYEN
jgi:hypothetical protein